MTPPLESTVWELAEVASILADQVVAHVRADRRRRAWGVLRTLDRAELTAVAIAAAAMIPARRVPDPVTQVWRLPAAVRARRPGPVAKVLGGYSVSALRSLVMDLAVRVPDRPTDELLAWTRCLLPPGDPTRNPEAGDDEEPSPADAWDTGVGARRAS